MFNFIRPNINSLWELKQIVDLASSHICQVEVEPLQVENQIVRNIFQTGPNALNMGEDVEQLEDHLPFYGINKSSTARLAPVFVVLNR